MLSERRSSAGHPVWVRYGVALLSVAVALFVHWLLDPELREHLGFVTIYGGIAFAIWYGRWRPAVVAAIVGWLAANYFFFVPGHFAAFDEKTIARLVGYIFSCAIIITLGEMLHRTRERTETEVGERKQAEQAESRQKELLLATLRSIGDAVILTDEQGRVTFLNKEAEHLTGWKSNEATGRPLPEIFRIVNEYTRQTVENPVEKVIRHGNVVGLANHTVLIAKDGREIPIDDSAAPIREQGGPLFGIVLVFRDFTERKKAQETTAHLATIVEHSRDAIFTKNLNGIVQSWNASAERLFGYRAEEIVGKPIITLFPPDRLNEEDIILAQLKEGRPVERFETVRVAKGGRQIAVSLSISPLKDPEGNVVGASKIVHDITELVAAREALLREKELMATTLASIGDAVIVTDADGRVAFMNPEAERLTKWSTVDAVDMPLPQVFNIVNEQTRKASENPVDKVLRLGSVVGLANHTLLIAKDGTEFPIDDSAAPIRQPGGPLFGVVLVFRDFTERKQAEDRLQELVARLENLVTYAPIAIALFDSDLKFVSVNDRAAEINGLPREAHTGKRPGELLPNVGPQEEEFIKKVRETGEPVLRVELKGETPARPGELRYWIASYYPVRHPNGSILGIGSIALEVTEQKRAEEALREAHEQLASRALHLERLVQQRTARLNEMIGDLEGFSYSIVHDMRGPLRAMNSFTQLLQEECGKVSPIAENYMKRIRTATVRMDRLIQDGLNYSRLMRAELPLVPVDVAALVRGILETYPTLQPPNAAVELTGKFPLIKANEATLTQCVSNLLGNAVKFVAPGVSPKVRVWAETRGDRVRLFFKDNGIGLPAGSHERIFQIFQRLDNTYEGTGIGLAIVKKAAERMGGTVGVESELGKGSTFWLELAHAEVETSESASKQT